MVLGGPINVDFVPNSNQNSLKIPITNSPPYIRKLKRMYFQMKSVIMPKILALVPKLNDGLIIDI